MNEQVSYVTCHVTAKGEREQRDWDNKRGRKRREEIKTEKKQKKNTYSNDEHLAHVQESEWVLCLYIHIKVLSEGTIVAPNFMLFRCEIFYGLEGRGAERKVKEKVNTLFWKPSPLHLSLSLPIASSSLLSSFPLSLPYPYLKVN